jgi:cysteine-S-conjugate beta-lyase
VDRQRSVGDPLEQLSLEELRGRTSVKWRAYDPDVLPMWVAEMDVPLAPAVVAALTDAVTRGDTGYACGPEYAEAFADVAASRWGWTFSPEHTELVPDVMLGVVEVLKLVTRPGHGVVVNTPVYPPFYWFIEHLDRQVIEAPLDAEHRIDLEVLEATFAREDVTAFLLCNPHNPTGTVHTGDELRVVAALADRHGVRVVSDEIHAPLVLAGTPFVPYLSLPEARSGFALLSASKAWNLAGAKAALAVAGERALPDLARLPDEVGHGASHLGVLAHTAALRGGLAWLDALLVGLERNRRLLSALLGSALPEVRYRPGEATYLAWLDVRGLGLGDDPAAVFRERGRVALSSGRDFGSGGAGHVRLNLGTSPALLEEGIRRMVAAC